MEEKRKKVLTTAIVIIVLVVLTWYWSSRDGGSTGDNQSASETDPAATSSLGSDLYSRINQEGGSIPKVEPFSNPLKGVYKNPFE